MIIGVVGACGKLGSLICTELQNHHFEVYKIDQKLNNCLGGENDIHSNIDALIDASSPTASLHCAKYCNKHNIPLLIACTGHSQTDIAQIHSVCKNIAYCICPNLSIGMLFIMQCLRYINLLDPPKITITEIHHKNKKDSPSGTAIAIQQLILKRSSTTPQIISLRQGSEVGTHSISVCLDNEEITLTHKAYNRNIFAKGARLAISQLINSSPGKYNFLDLIGAINEN